MDSDNKSRRYTERRKTSIPGTVKWYDPEDRPLEESTGFVDVSRLGVRFGLSRSLEPGQPVYLVFPMPAALRGYDRKEHDYRVWGIVRSSIPSVDGSNNVGFYQVGVALTGGSEPHAYGADHKTRYDLKPFPSKDGFWQVRELPRRK